MTEKASIILGDKSFEPPVITGTENEVGLHSSNLRKETGLVTLDPGFASTASCQSEITFINGSEGILRYRGYPIEQVAGNATFLETAYLLIWGTLPTQEQLDTFTAEVGGYAPISDDMKGLFRSFSKDAHPMGVLSSATAALSTYYQDENDLQNPYHIRHTILRLIAKLPTLAAWAHRAAVGETIVDPDPKLSYAENFLRMMFCDGSGSYTADPEIVEALDLLLVLHADHEQNASATAVRVVGSTQVNLYAAIASGINALWGPLHGGANQAVLEQLTEIRDSDTNTETFIARAKDREDPFRLMGFGHRVYKNSDPRAMLIKDAAHKVLAKVGGDDALFQIAQELEEAALNDDFFIERKLYPNVDFYSGLIYRAMGIPTEMFTVMFAIGRLPGWIAQWNEMMNDPMTRIYRPRQIYQGPTERDFVPIDER